jgi:hypothetical protein
MKHEIAHMRAGGSIVNIASIGVTAIPRPGAYGVDGTSVCFLPDIGQETWLYRPFSGRISTHVRVRRPPPPSQPHDDAEPR